MTHASEHIRSPHGVTESVGISTRVSSEFVESSAVLYSNSSPAADNTLSESLGADTEYVAPSMEAKESHWPSTTAAENADSLSVSTESGKIATETVREPVKYSVLATKPLKSSAKTEEIAELFEEITNYADPTFIENDSGIPHKSSVRNGVKRLSCGRKKNRNEAILSETRTVCGRDIDSASSRTLRKRPDPPNTADQKAHAACRLFMKSETKSKDEKEKSNSVNLNAVSASAENGKRKIDEDSVDDDNKEETTSEVKQAESKPEASKNEVPKSLEEENETMAEGFKSAFGTEAEKTPPSINLPPGSEMCENCYAD